MMKYLKVFHDWPETVEVLADDEQLRLIKGMIYYSRGDVELAYSTLTGNERFLFAAFKSQIDRDIQKWNEQSVRNAENGSRGGRPRKIDDAS